MQADKRKHQAQEGPDVPHVEERDNVSGANGQAPAQEEPGTGIAQAEETPDVNKLKEQLDQTNDRLLRLHAEFDNYRKRTAKERLDLVLTASEDVIKGMLPVLDDCQRALRTLEKLENADPVSVEGVNLIYSKLLTYLQGRGLKIIEAKGKPLDTDFHCAVAKTPVKEKKLKGKIVDVVMEGYTLNGKVIRFANVVVGE
ncbi:MAG: nucleotide exchange factor GrpE [Burkholderiales bacterium]|jgi:molecular chaperone GrpE|nr:nucleotide exchange factor GrpE [Burkholderiales bacterium]